MDAVQIYRAYVTAILTVAIALALATMAGSFDSPIGGPVLPQQGIVVQSYDASRVLFNDDVILDTNQVEGR